MAQDTTVFQYLINSEYIAAMISRYQGKKVLDAIFAEGARVEDETGLNSADAMLKANTLLVNSFDGKAKVVRVPIMPKATGSVTALAESSDDSVEVTYTPTYSNITINEYGRQKATTTGKAELQTFDGAVAQLLTFMVESMADTKERLIAAKAFAGGTKAASEAADAVKYFQVGPVDQGASVYKPDGLLTPEAIEDALVLLRDTAEPFSNGLYMGLIHPEQRPALMAAAGNQLESFQLYQAASPFPSNMRMGIVGVWKGVMWFEVANSYMKVASGAHDGTAAYKTAIFGKNFLAKAFVPTGNLPLSETSDIQQIPFDDFVIRIVPDATDHHRRNHIITPYFVGGYEVGDRDAGLYIVAKSNFAASAAADVA